MKRTLLTALVSTSLLVAPSCKDKADGDQAAAKEGEAKDGDAKAAAAEAGEKKGDADAKAAPGGDAKDAGAGLVGTDPKDALALIPDGAFMALTMDVAGLQKIPSMGVDLIEQAIQDPDDKETYAAMKDCGLTINLMSRMTMGGEDREGGKGGGGMGILDGKGVSEKGKAECMAKWLEEKKNKKFTFEDGDGFTRMKQEGDDGIVYLVGSDRIIFTDGDYAPKVEEMIAGKGAKAVDGSLAGALAVADLSASISGVAGVSDAQRAKMGPDAGPLKEMNGAAFSARPNGDGVKFEIKIAMPDEAKAGAAKAFMEQGYAQVKPMAAMLQIPPNVANAVTFGNEGSTAMASLALSAADLEQLKKIAETQAGAMGGAGMPPGGMPPGQIPPGGKPGAPPAGAPAGM